MTNDNYLLVHARETFKTTLTPDAKLLYMAMIATKRGKAFYWHDSEFQTLTGLEKEQLDLALYELAGITSTHHLVDICEDGDRETYIQFTKL